MSVSNFRFPTPAEATARRAQALEPAVKQLRDVVFAALVKPTSSREIWVDLSKVRVATEAVAIVRAELEAAGWESRYESSQRDGNSLVVWPAREAA